MAKNPITRKGEARKLDRAPGVIVSIMTDHQQITLCEVLLDPGSVVPMHTHVHEQSGTLISGQMEFEIDGVTHDLRPGDAWMIPGGVPHEARAIEKCVVIEAFSPPREDWRAP
jgi:quercetin dioxygenase-like cupin family protein